MLSRRITRFVVVPQLAAILLVGSPWRLTQPASLRAGEAAPECISAGPAETNSAVLSKPTPGTHAQERLASTPLDSAAVEAALQRAWMPVNVESALFKFAQARQLGYPQTDEFEFTLDGEGYIGQVYASAFVYVPKSDFGKIRLIQKAESGAIPFEVPGMPSEEQPLPPPARRGSLRCVEASAAAGLLTADAAQSNDAPVRAPSGRERRRRRRAEPGRARSSFPAWRRGHQRPASRSTAACCRRRAC